MIAKIAGIAANLIADKTRISADQKIEKSEHLVFSKLAEKGRARLARQALRHRSTHNF
jgi:hypothetical protein